jgi:hypothetical protein
MYLFHIFRSLVPLRNPIGFGASDLIALGLALTALLVIFGDAYLGDGMRSVARRTGLCMVALFVLPIALRLALLTRASAPAPDTAAEFSSLLAADTLLHGRIRNPPHAFSEFFEAPLVEQRPVYRSTLPVGDGLLLALGLLVLRDSWAGILLGIGALAALSYWMLRGWVAAGWALLGGAAVGCAFGPLCGWTNGYWGGFAAALGGCMIVGALPRLRARRRAGDAAMLVAGVTLEVMARPSAFCLLLPMLVLATMAALKILSEIRGDVFWVVVVMFAAHFLFWYGMHAVADEAALRAVSAYAGRDFVDDPERQMHRAVNAELNRQPGKQLVFVRRGVWHGPGEWIHNSADIDASRIVWVRDLGQENDRKLIDYYGGRTVWLLEPDTIPPRLRACPSDAHNGHQTPCALGASSGLLENVQ